MHPVDPTQHLDALRKGYEGGDVLALLQAIRYAQSGVAALPGWAMVPLDNILVGTMTKSEKGTKGKGNAPFASVRKDYVRAIRASAYHRVRAWQRNPHRYVDMPRATILFWYKEKDVDLWLGWRNYMDASRLAEIGLRGTPFRAKAATVRKSAIKFPPPQPFGRSELETELGLRGTNGVFGPPPGDPPDHVRLLLSKHPVAQ